MSNGIDVKREGEAVRIDLRLSGKKSWFKVTPEYARALAAELLEAAGGDESFTEDFLRHFVDGVCRDAGEKA